VGSSVVVVAGATGSLGGLIARSLRERGERVRAIVRPGTARGKALQLQQLGVNVVEADYANAAQLTRACDGASCVVSALAGLRDVMVDAQTSLLDAAVKAGVPRFIPSDYAIDFYKLPNGHNRNLDLRREFSARLDAAPIAATSVLAGMFADMLTGQAPFILFRIHRVVYWQNADQLMDFTTMEDTAAFTARAALDHHAPRFLRIAGDVASARELAAIASSVTGEEFKLLRAGDLGRFEKLIWLARTLSPGKDEVYPPWQGMQYMHDMFDGRAKLEPIDNARYPELRWTTIPDILKTRARAPAA
jgi:uncharacterized protein YbjT (DUF2867 family)